MMTAWSQPASRTTASAALNHALSFWSIFDPHFIFTINIFLFLLFASCNNRRFPRTHTQARTILPSIFLFLFSICCGLSLPSFCVQHAAAVGLPRWIAPFQNTHSLGAARIHAVDPDRCNFCPIRLPFFPSLPSFRFVRFPTLVLFVLLTSFPRVSSRLFLFSSLSSFLCFVLVGNTLVPS